MRRQTDYSEPSLISIAANAACSWADDLNLLIHQKCSKIQNFEHFQNSLETSEGSSNHFWKLLLLIAFDSKPILYRQNNIYVVIYHETYQLCELSLIINTNFHNTNFHRTPRYWTTHGVNSTSWKGEIESISWELTSEFKSKQTVAHLIYALDQSRQFQL